MDKFTIRKKGYDCAEVDAYLAKMTACYEKAAEQQRERIEEMKRELAGLEERLACYREKEDSINEALTGALEKAKNIEYAAKVRYCLEGERLNVFHEKWRVYFKDKAAVYGVPQRTECEAFFDRAREELRAMMNSALNPGEYAGEAEQAYARERVRLSAIEPVREENN